MYQVIGKMRQSSGVVIKCVALQECVIEITESLEK